MGILLAAILPALLYAFIVYLSTPYKSVNLKTAFTYFFIGMTSIFLVYGKFIAFPEWSNTVSINFLLNNIITAFIQVALIEEICKFVPLKVLDLSRFNVNKKIDLPIATMFYSMMISIGFAVIENISYVRSYGDYVLVVRSFTAVIAHMISGLIMGYFIALGNMDTNLKNISVMNIFLKRHHKYRVLIFSFFGILASTIFHGFYDFIVMNSYADRVDNVVYTLVGGLLITYFMGKHLSGESVKVLNKYTPTIVNIKRSNGIKKGNKGG